jgi:hypothetical protein
VLVDLERIMAFPRHDLVRRERALQAAGRRWAGHVRHRQQSARRQLVLGGKAALSLPRTASKVSPDRACAAHGEGCQVESVSVRDHARDGVIVWRSRGNPFGGRPTKQTLASFCAKVTDHTPKLANVQTQVIWRAAG